MLFYCICKLLAFSTLYPHSTLSHLIHTSSSTATRPTPFGLSLTHTRGRNAHKKRANIRRKSEFAKVLALIFKHLAYFALFFSHTKCWHTIRPTLPIERKPSQNSPHDYTTRDAHIAHHPLSYNLMLTRPNNINHTAITASESNIAPSATIALRSNTATSAITASESNIAPSATIAPRSNTAPSAITALGPTSPPSATIAPRSNIAPLSAALLTT